ncbi:MAG: choice-of-anchor J domain-containing protein [Bacteroidales bacterium]|jgi:hypothetical protein|nr:choice-of-anchor J domain-containing protein [Bacteroidales bacterium]
MKKLLFFVFFLLLFRFCFSQAIFFEGFEETTFPPAGWTILDVSGAKTWERITYTTHGNSLGSAMHDFAGASQGLQKTALITPQIVIPNYGNPELDFWSYVQLIGYQYSGILISTTVNTNLEAFTEVKVLSGDEIQIASWKNIVVPLDNYLGQSIYIAFLYSNTDGHRWFIDDVKVNHFAGFVDIQPFGITPVSGNYPLFSTSEQISVRIKNNGGSAASGFSLKLFDNEILKVTESFNGSIPSLGEATYIFNTTLDLSAAGIHKVQVVTNLTGDQIQANDTATSMINNLGCNVHTSFPYFEGFEDNGNNLPLCWTQEYVAENYNWRVCNAAWAQGIPGLEPKTAFEGNYKVFFYTNGKDGAITKLITPPLNITSMNNPVLKFHHIQQFYTGDQDSLKIYYKTGAHQPWVFLEKYTETLENWTERIIPLPQPSTQYYIAFEAYAEYGASVQIDAMNVCDYVTSDIAVKEITPKGVHLNLSNHEVVKVTIKNNGRNPVAGFDLSLYCNDGLISKEVYTNTIPGLGEAIYTFNAKVDLSVSGYYTLKVIADLEGDEVPENNELTAVVRNLVCDALTFPYDEGFEEEIFPPHCWTKIGEWKSMPYSAHTGKYRACYSWWDGSLGWLISPKFSIPSYGDFMLEFWSHVYDRKYFTYSGVWVSTTNTNTSSFTEILSLSGDLTPDEVWKRIEVPLSAYAGKNIYVAFKYTNTGGESGHCWSLDDINVFNLNNFIDAEIVEISAPPSLGMNLTAAETVTVKIKNNGGANISGFQLKLEYNGEEIATENYTGYIISLAAANYTFNKKLNLSAAGNHIIKVTVVLPDDMNPNNDSKTKIVENRVCPPVTSFPWQGKFQGILPGEISNCWINIDADGDTKKWFSLETNGTYYAISKSNDTTYGISLTPDNWLLTPPLVINQSAYLTCKIGGADSEQNGAEKYSILISTTGIAPAEFIAVRTETLYPSDYTEWLTGELTGYGVKTIKIPLSTYIGKQIHIAFRHWDCTNQKQLILSNIEVKEELSVPKVIDNKSLIAWMVNDKLYVSELKIDDCLEVYSVMGKLLYSSKVTNDTMSIKLNTRGIYIIKSGNSVKKVAY